MSVPRYVTCVAAASLATAAQAQLSGPGEIGNWVRNRASVGLSMGRSDFTLPCAPGISCVSVVGLAAISPRFSVYGTVGTGSGYADMGLPGGAPPVPGFDVPSGAAYSAGLKWDFSRSASATFGLDSRELRLGPAREPVRSARLGLRWKY